MRYYFVRVNGPTLHDDPKNRDCFVAIEPKSIKRVGYSNYLNYCLENDIVRIGWPDVGDLIEGNRLGAKANCYNLSTIEPYKREYLLAFRDIQLGSILLVPDRDKSGVIYICEVVKSYWYDSAALYECSHRVGVKWDRDNQGRPVSYTTEQLGIVKGGWWLRAFHELKELSLINRIVRTRKES